MNKIAITILLLGISLTGRSQDSLSAYLQVALENNPSVRSAYEGFYASVARGEQAGVLPDPTLGIGYFISPVETRVGPQQFRFSLTQMFPWFGTLGARGQQLDKQSEASFWQFAQEARLVTRKVRAAYYELWVTKEIIELEKENLALVQSIESLATTRFRSGDGRLAEVLLVQLDEKELQNSIARTQELLATRMEQFILLLNKDIETLYLPDTIQAALPVLGMQDSLTEHPLVKASLARSEAATAYAEVARKQGYPNLGVGLDYVVIGKREGMSIPENGKNALMPMVTIGLPIWRKKYASMKTEAEATQRQFLEAARSEQNQLLSARTEAEYTLQRALRDMELYQEQSDLASRMLTLTESDFANDRAQFDDILEYQEKLLYYQKQALMSYGELLKALTYYDYLTGENPAVINELNTYEN